MCLHASGTELQGFRWTIFGNLTLFASFLILLLSRHLRKYRYLSIFIFYHSRRSPIYFRLLLNFHPLCTLFTGFADQLKTSIKLAVWARYRPFSWRVGVLLFIQQCFFNLFAAVPLPCPARFTFKRFQHFLNLSGTTRYGCLCRIGFTFPSTWTMSSFIRKLAYRGSSVIPALFSQNGFQHHLNLQSLYSSHLHAALAQTHSASFCPKSGFTHPVVQMGTNKKMFNNVDNGIESIHWIFQHW
jgi:hypothetical protein